MNWFGLFWLGGVAFAGFWQVAWGWRALRTGIATVYARFEVSRDEKPFEFWMIVTGRIFGFFVAVAMFIFGLQFFGEMNG